MSPTVQIAVDCADPHPLNEFWAAAMGYEVEIHEDMIRGFLESGEATEADTTEFQGRLVWAIAAACRDPEGRGPRLLFQQVPEPKTVKDRIHLDLQFGPDRKAAEVERLLGLGATFLWEGQQGPHSWVTLADPEGNEFCVS